MRLEADGIKTFVPDQTTASVQPLYSDAMGGIRIQIDEADLAHAREVLKDFNRQPSKGMLQCPKCNSESVEYGQTTKRFAFLSILVLGIPLLWFKRDYKCNSCGYAWKKGKCT